MECIAPPIAVPCLQEEGKPLLLLDGGANVDYGQNI